MSFGFLIALNSCKNYDQENKKDLLEVSNVYQSNQSLDTISNVVNQKFDLLGTVLSQLNLDKSKIKNEFVVFKGIPNNPNETILVIPEIEVEEVDYLELNSYIIIANTKTGKIINKYFENNAWTSDAIRLTEITIDTAPYQISEKDKAFGICATYSGSSRPNPYEGKKISLFIKSGTSLKKVLDNYEILYYGGEWDTNCEGEFFSLEKLLIVSQNKTNDYFDFTIINNITKSKNILDEDGNCDTEEKVLNEKLMLQFNGVEYTEVK